MKCVVMIGVPGVGKTTVTRNMLMKLGCVEKVMKYKTIHGTYYGNDRVFILGNYETTEVFAGTDTLSMAMQKDMPIFLEMMHRTFSDDMVLFGEGSRVTNGAFLTCAQKYCDIKIVYLFASEKVCEVRRMQRGTQSLSWVRGMQTNVRRLCERYPVFARCNETVTDIEENSLFLYDFLTRGIRYQTPS